MARSTRRRQAVAKLPRMSLRPTPGDARADASIAVRYVRFMDETFGPGNWERHEGEPEHNEIMRMGMFMAFKAGAGVD